MKRSEELAVKLERVERWLAEKELDGAVLSRSDNFAWLGCGACNVVNTAQETGVGALVVERGSLTLAANNVETERLLTEELHGLNVAAETFPWHEPARRAEAVRRLCKGKRFAADDGSAGLPPLPAGFSSLRDSLTESEVARYRDLGVRASLIVEAAAVATEKGMAECEVAGLLAMGCRQMGIEPIVLLVAADDRIRNWRHPIVKDARANQYAMVVVCGRRQGLVAALTRLVHFGELPEDLKRRHRAVCAVDAAMMKATTPGKGAREVFAEAQAAYARNGFADEWLLHHQGGAIGYQPREYIATPSSKEVVQVRQAFAWNPSIRGTKSEDTILVGERGFELLTAPSSAWPVVTVDVAGEAIPRADILVK